MKLISRERRNARELVAAQASAAPVRRPYRSTPSPGKRLWRQSLLLAAISVAMTIYGFLFSWLPPAFLSLTLAPLAVLALIVVWAMPDTERPPVRSMEWTFGAFFVALVLWPYYLAVQIPGLPLIEPRRALNALMILLFLVSLSTSSRFRAEMADIFRANRTLVKMFVAFVAVQAVSIVFAPNKLGAATTFLKNQLGWTAVFFIALYVFSRPGWIRRWVILFGALALTLSVMSFLEYRNEGVLWANHIPSFLRVNDPAMAQLLTAVFREGRYRVVTTFSVSLSLAEFMAIAMPFFIHGVFRARTWPVRLACLAADGMLFATILLTQARVGIVGAIVAHAVYGFVWALRLWRTNKQSLFGPAATLAYPAVFILLGIAVLSVGRLRVATLGGGTHAASTSGRLEQAAQTWPLLGQSPLFGYGPRQGAGVLGYTNPAGEVSIDSYILSILLDYGVIGFVLYFGMFLFTGVKAAQLGSKVREGELAYVLPAGVAFFVYMASRIVLAQEDNASLSFILLALVAAAAYVMRPTETPTARR